MTLTETNPTELRDELRTYLPAHFTIEVNRLNSGNIAVHIANGIGAYNLAIGPLGDAEISPANIAIAARHYLGD